LRESTLRSSSFILPSLALRVFYSYTYLLLRLKSSFFLVFDKSFFFSNSVYSSLFKFWYFLSHSLTFPRISSVYASWASISD
jgi:hypothetical protein